MSRVTDKVTAIDPDGKGIVVTSKLDGAEWVVGAIITPDTAIKVGGKKAGLDQIKVGDTVTLVWEKTTDLYAKEILKK
jgi:hypothetical protein